MVSLNVICNHLDTFYIQDTGGQSECHLQSPGHVLHSGHWWSVGMSFAITWTRFTFRTLVVSRNVICNHLDTFYIQDTGGQSECHLQSPGHVLHSGHWWSVGMSFAITWTRFTFRTLVVSLNVICNHLDTFYIQDTGGQSECHLQSPGHVLHSGHWWSVGMSFAITWTRFTFRTLVVSLNVICNHLDTFYIQDTGGQSECHLQSPGHVLHSGHWWSV